jgi:hypothetical protein
MNQRQRLNILLRDLGKKGLLGKAVIIPETEHSRQVHQDVTQYLDSLKQFEADSKRVDIIVGGTDCAYCHPATVHHYPNYC